MLAAINRVIDRVENVAMVIFMLVATVVAIIQVVARYGFNNSLYWSEELIIYSLISMSFIAGSMGVRYAAHIAVEVLPVLAGPKVAKVLHVVATILGILFALMLIWYGGMLSLKTLRIGQLSPAMRFPVGYVYAIIPISGVLMLLRHWWILVCVVFNRPYQSLSMGITSGT